MILLSLSCGSMRSKVLFCGLKIKYLAIKKRLKEIKTIFYFFFILASERRLSFAKTRQKQSDHPAVGQNQSGHNDFQFLPLYIPIGPRTCEEIGPSAFL